MKRTISMLMVISIAGFGTFFANLRNILPFNEEEVPTTQPETTIAPYIRPEGVHPAPDGNGKQVALTFDDGPGGAVTSHILDTLQEVGGKATFFCLGNRAKEYQTILRRMTELGCEVASHSYSHERLTRLSNSELQADLEKTNEALANYSGQHPKLMRPPYGSVSDRMLNNVAMPVLLWSIDSEDWRYCEQLCKDRSEAQRQKDLLAVVNSVLEYVQDGDIILMHDLYSFTQDVADTVIAELHHQGWQLVTVSELFDIKGIKPQPGEVYHCAR